MKLTKFQICNGHIMYHTISIEKHVSHLTHLEENKIFLKK